MADGACDAGAGVRATVLIIEDDPEIQKLLELSMAGENWRLAQAKSGEEGLARLAAGPADCILLDIMLPGIDGLKVIKKIRKIESCRTTPIIMTTAKDAESDIVAALELGADDYVAKPYSPKVLVARIRAALRRREDADEGAEARPKEAHALRQGRLSLDSDRHEAFLNGARLDLLPTEFALLRHFLSNPDIVFTRGRLIAAVKGPGYPATDRSIDVQILGLRKKLADAGGMIETVRGIGYRFRAEG